VLAGSHPDFQVGFHLVADGQQIDVTTLHGKAQVVDLAQAGSLRLAQQVQVLFVRVGFEIGVVHAVGQRDVFYRHLAIVLCGTRNQLMRS
jgi:hypothetical protein